MTGDKKLRRMQRNHDRAKKQAPFNIVSLMDIFTILVFFLLVNAADPSVLPNAKGIVMPESIAEQKPRVSVVLMLLFLPSQCRANVCWYLFSSHQTK